MHNLTADLQKDLLVTLSVPDFHNSQERKPPFHTLTASVKESDGTRRVVMNKDEGDEIRVPLGDMHGVIDLYIEFYYFDYTADDDLHAVVNFHQDEHIPSVDDHNPVQSEIKKRFIATLCVFEINVSAA